MSKKKPGELIKFEPGSKQPFILFMIVTVIISAVIIIIALISSGVSFDSVDDKDLGDINGDGKIDSADVLLMMNHVSDKEKLTGEMFKRADINSDKTVNSNDAYYLIQYVNKSSNQSGINSATDYQTTQPDSTTDQNQSEPENDGDGNIENEPKLSGKSYSSAFLTGENQLYYSARIVNRWQSEKSVNMYQIELKIKNNSEKTVYNTSADISFTSSVSIESYNGCTAKENETGALTVKTDNKGSIKSGGTYTCTFVVSCEQEADISSVVK